MARIDPSIPGSSLGRSAEDIRRILSNVAELDSGKVAELVELLNKIRDYNPEVDDDKSIGEQLVNVFKNMVDEDEVQTEVNDSTYPPQSKAVKTALEAHKNATELEHADGSVKGRHIADNAIATSQLRDNIITASKLLPNIISENHLTNSLQTKINNAIDEEILLKYASIISTAPKYKLSDLHRDDIGYDIPGNTDEYFILKNDTSETYDTGILWNDAYVWEVTKPIRNGKSYLCVLRELVDTGNNIIQNGKIEVVTEMGSDIIDLQTASKGWNGTWKYGTALAHTEGRVSSDEIANVKAGDYYLNSKTYSVYHTDNGTDWLYIGNLAGSIDTTKWAPLNSPHFEGLPTAPTPTVSNNSTQIATTEFVRNAIDNYGGSGNNNITSESVNYCLALSSYAPNDQRVIDGTVYYGGEQTFSNVIYTGYNLLINKFSVTPPSPITLNLELGFLYKYYADPLYYSGGFNLGESGIRLNYTDNSSEYISYTDNKIIKKSFNSEKRIVNNTEYMYYTINASFEIPKRLSSIEIMLTGDSFENETPADESIQAPSQEIWIEYVKCYKESDVVSTTEFIELESKVLGNMDDISALEAKITTLESEIAALKKFHS